MAEILITAAEKLLGILMDPVKTRVINMYNLKENVRKLKKKVEELKSTKQSVIREIEDAKGQGFVEAVMEVRAWEAKVNDFIKELATMMPNDDFIKEVATKRPNENEQEDQTKMQCIRGLTWKDLKKHYDLSMNVEDLTKECSDLIENGKFTKVVRRKAPSATKSISVKEYEAFDSRKESFSAITEALKDTRLKTIGVYGAGGVGKSTLVKKVLLQAAKDELHDNMVMVDVTKTSEFKQIQQEIADGLGIKLKAKVVHLRAQQLREALKHNKRVLVVFDNVRKALDLEEIGIPVENVEKASLQQTGDQKGRNVEKANLQQTGDQKGRKGDQAGGDQKGRKVDQRHCRTLLVARDIKICKDMKTESNIPVEPLSHKEAMEFLLKMVDDSTKQSSRFESIAGQIVEKCNGLPFVIANIAKTLKSGGQYVLDAVVNLLVNFDYSIVDENHHSIIELSYKFLKKKEAKSLFLLCSIHDEGDSIHIDDLVRYGIGLGWFQDVNTLKAARKKVDELIKDLKVAGLLLDDITNNFVRMEDVIHSMAQRIASKDNRIFSIQNVTDLEQELEKDEYKDSVAISLLLRDADELPKKPEFRRLNLFSLSVDDEGLSLQIPDNFFESMKELKVLYLNKVHLSSLTPSLSYLTNLRTLCLDYCQLEDISAIGKLDKLVVLSFSNSSIKKLPEEVGGLTRLKLLDLHSCLQLEEIPPNVLSKLTRLEELYMGDSFVKWDVKANASLLELKELRSLTNLEIHVMDAEIIPQHLFLETLERFVIFIGDDWDWYDEYEMSRVLKLKLKNKNCLGRGVKMFLKKTEELHLDELNSFMNVHPQLGEGFPDLKHLQIQNDSQIENIVKQEGWDPYNAFPMLESIILDNLSQFKKICQGKLRRESFGQLKTIKVENCDALTHLISFSMAETISHLQEIEVANCRNLTEIVKKSEGDDKQILEINFTKLNSLTLKCLPMFRTFGFVASTVTSEITPTDNCEDSMTLFGKKVYFPSLGKLNLSSLRIRSLWQLPPISSFGKRLKHLVVEKCSDLKFLFSSHMVESVRQLEKLEIAYCESMEMIISAEGTKRENSIKEIIFPNLTYLVLKNLPELTSFGSANSVEFPSLEQLSVKTCPKLKRFLSRSKDSRKKASKDPEMISRTSDVDTLFDEKVVLTALKKLKLSSIDVERIWPNQSLAESSGIQRLATLIIDGCDRLTGPIFPLRSKSKSNQKTSGSISSLKTLEVRNCNNLVYLFTFSMASRLESLQEVEIEHCAKMEEVVRMEGKKDAAGTKIFPLLHSLYLEDLHEFQRFCSFTGNIIISLPSLSILQIDDCPRMKTFVSNSSSTVLTPNMRLEETNSEERLHASMVPLFDEKIKLPNLEILQIYHMDNLEKIWHSDKLNETSFQNLQELRLLDCEKLLYVFPRNMLERLEKLESLKLFNCDSLENIVDKPESSSSMEEENVHRFVFPRLTSVKLWMLPRLKWFYPDLHISEWPLLKKLVVYGCDIAEIFASEYHSLYEQNQRGTKLPKTLFIVGKVAFPNLEVLKLTWNDVLKEVWHGEFLLYSLRLKIFKLKQNPEIREFPSYFLDTLPDLETLVVSEFPFKEIFSSEGVGYDKTYVPSLSQHTLSQLKDLRLYRLTDLVHLCKEDTESSKLFQSVTSLKVLECDSLEYLVPACVSFRNLTNLEISQCNVLVYLLTFSTVKSLVQLTEMKITNCEKLENIITLSGDEVDDEIVFRKLEKLHLDGLPSLMCFYLGSQTLEFPLLEEVIVSECPKMEMFSNGNLMTTKLNRVKFKDDEDQVEDEEEDEEEEEEDSDEDGDGDGDGDGESDEDEAEDEEEDGGKDDWCWHGDLNNTIKTMFKEMNAQNSKEE